MARIEVRDLAVDDRFWFQDRGLPRGMMILRWARPTIEDERLILGVQRSGTLKPLQSVVVEKTQRVWKAEQ